MDDLLLLRCGAALDLDVRALPERGDVGLLPREDRVEALFQRTVQRPRRPGADLARRRPLAVVVAEKTSDPDRLAGLAPNLEHGCREIVLAAHVGREGAPGFDRVLHAAAEREPEPRGGEAEDRAQTFGHPPAGRSTRPTKPSAMRGSEVWNGKAAG